MTAEFHKDDGWSIKKEFSIGDGIAILVAFLTIVSVYYKVDTRLIVLENDKQDRKEYFNRYEAKSDDQFKEISRKLDKLTEVWLSREARALIQDQNSMAGMGGNGRR